LVGSSLLADLPLNIVTVGKTNQDPQAIANLGTAEKVLEKAGFKLEVELLVGHAEEAIVRYQEDNAIDLLLMGAHGHSRIRHLVIGSTTAQVLRKTSIPVLTFR
jgi:nucleotide-binding universal stress UspA family protein